MKTELGGNIVSDDQLVFNIASKRILWIDVAKGIAIILMVVGHSSIPEVFSRWIWSFHMPLFFIASGFCTNWYRYDDFCLFLRNKTKHIILPFFLYSSIVLFFFLNFLNIEIDLYLGWYGYALWFVPVLFCASLLCYLITRFDKRVVSVLILLLPLLSWYFYYTPINLPWNMSVVPYASFLILIGSYLKIVFEKRQFERHRVIYVCLGFVISTVISHFWRLDMASNTIAPVVQLTIGAISGTLFVFGVSSLIVDKNKVLTNILTAVGRETFIIMAFAQLVIMCLNEYTKISPIVKYSLLIVVLLLAVVLKNIFNKGLKLMLEK